MTHHKRIAILPGSYDPMTCGHVALAARAAKLFDRIVVAVMQNDTKNYTFTTEQRLLLAKASLRDIPNCEVICDSGMLIDLYARLGASCVIKGLRNETDYSYESVQAEWNREHLHGFETIYLPSDRKLISVSSTEVRKRLAEGSDLGDLLMPAAAELLQTEAFRKLK